MKTWRALVIATTTATMILSTVMSVDGSSRQVGVDPEIYMSPTQEITSKGYPCENHYVTTKDGFILNLQRISHGRRQATYLQSSQPAVILQHGLLGSAYNWIDNLANQSLAYLLADHGADVWLGNIRGSTYSKNHTRLKPDQDEFWDWSFDEMAAYDLPAMFDYVRRVSGVEQVHYVGHSQGTMIGFAGFTTNKTLAAMVKRFYALAPVAMVANIESPIKRLAPYSRDISKAFELFGHGAYDQYNRRLHDFLARDVCKKLGLVLCEDDLFVIGGVDKPAMNISRVPVYIAHSPGGTSVKNIVHFAQGISYNAFQMFNYGSAAANTAKYGQPTPPQYHPEKLQVPVVAYTGDHDILADPTDVAWLLQRIKPTLLARHNMPSWEHLDFIWAMDAPQHCYDNIIHWVFSDQ